MERITEPLNGSSSAVLISSWYYDSEYNVLLQIEFYASLLYLLMAVYMLAKLLNMALIHGNLRILLGSMISCIALMVVGRFASRTLFFITGEQARLKTNIAKNIVCTGFHILYIVNGFVSGTFPVAIAVERYLATRMRSRYEKMNYRIGMLITSISYIVYTVLALISTAVAVLYDSDIFMDYRACDISYFYPSLLPLVAPVALVAYVISIITLYCLYRRNRILNKIESRNPMKNPHSLSGRYQASENIATMNALIPALAGIGVWESLLCLYSIISMTTMSDASEQFARLFKITSLATPIYGLYFLAVLIFRFKPLRKSVYEDLRRLKARMCPTTPAFCFATCTLGLNIGDVSRVSSNEQEAHFKQLRELWDGKI